MLSSTQGPDFSVSVAAGFIALPLVQSCLGSSCTVALSLGGNGVFLASVFSLNFK